MSKVPALKGKVFLKYLLKYSCRLIRDNGSHKIIENLNNNKHSVVAFHGGDDINTVMFDVVLKQLGIDKDDFINFINDD